MDIHRELLDSLGVTVVNIDPWALSSGWITAIHPEDRSQVLDACARAVLYMSGYINSGVEQQTLVDPGAAFIQKPFAPTVLLQKVREVLSEPALHSPRGGRCR